MKTRTQLLADLATINAIPGAGDSLELCYVEAAGDNAFAVKWKSSPEAMGETVTVDTFPTQKEADAYCALMNQMRIDWLRVDAARAAEAATEAETGVDDGDETSIAQPAMYADGSSELPTEDIRNVQVIKAGTWTAMSGEKVTFTKADLAELVSNFHALRSVIKPYLKLGHIFDGDHTKLTAAPALGWMENPRLADGGNTIEADFMKVPARVAKLIRAKSYRRISAEILRNFSDQSGKVYRLAFKAASLLGATLPAINTMDDIIKELFGEGARATALVDELSHAEMVALSEPQEDSVMNEAQLAALRLSLGLPADADATAVLAAAANLQKANTDSTVKLSELEETQFAAGVDALVKRAKEEGRVLPPQEAGIRTMVAGWKKEANGEPMQFAFGEKKGTGTVLEAFSAFVDSLPQVFPIRKEAGSGKVSNPGATVRELPADVIRFASTAFKYPLPVDADSLERDRSARAHAKENKVTYLAAYSALNGLELDVLAN